MLNDTTRKTSHKGQVNGKWQCDSVDESKYTSQRIRSPDWKGEAWYRISMPAGSRIPEQAPSTDSCGGASGWLSGTHPTELLESVEAKFCFNECSFLSNKGKITNCGEYFVYYLEDTPSCNRRYCATN